MADKKVEEKKVLPEEDLEKANGGYGPGVTIPKMVNCKHCGMPTPNFKSECVWCHKSWQ